MREHFSRFQNPMSSPPPVPDKADKGAIQASFASSFPPEFFDDDFDGVGYVFGKHAREPRSALSWVESEEHALSSGLRGVEDALTTRLNESYDAFVEGMQHVRSLKTDLSFAGVIVSNGRRNLGTAKETLLSSGLQVSHAVASRETVSAVYALLSSLQALQNHPAEIDACLADGHYARALALASSGLEEAHALEGVDAAELLASRLAGARANVLSSMRDALKAAFVQFDPEKYASLLEGYANADMEDGEGGDLSVKALGDVVVEAVRSAFRSVLLDVVLADPSLSDKKKKWYVSNKKTRELAALIPETRFVPTLRALASKAADLLYNYSSIESWHKAAARAANEAETLGKEVPVIIGVGAILSELRGDKLWGAIEKYIVQYISVAHISLLPAKDVFATLELGQGLIVIGTEYSSTRASSLRSSIKSFASLYFETTHGKALEHLKTMLENDTWQKWPVPDSFGVADLKFQRSHDSVLVAPITQGPSLTSRFALSGNPFRAPETTPDLSTLSSSSSPSSSATAAAAAAASSSGGGPLVCSATISLLKTIADYVNLLPGLAAAGAEVLTGMEELLLFYVFTVYKVFGLRGQDMVRALTFDESSADASSSSANDPSHAGTSSSTSSLSSTSRSSARSSMSRAASSNALLDHHKSPKSPSKTSNGGDGGNGGGGDGGEDGGSSSRMGKTRNTSSSSLSGLLSRSSKNGDETRAAVACVQADPWLSPGSRAGVRALILRGLSLVPLASLPTLCSIVNVSSPTTLYGIAERVVGIESIMFIRDVFVEVEDLVRDAVAPELLPGVDALYDTVVVYLEEFRTYMYHNVGTRLMDLATAYNNLTGTNFNLKDVGMDHSQYVNLLTRESQMLASRFTSLSEDNVPGPIQALLWESVIECISEILLDGYATIKKCTNEGRALMFLDLSVFKAELEKLTTVSPLPGFPRVEAFVKAFYLQEDEIMPWLKDHVAEYGIKHFLGLINSGAGGLGRKSRQKAIAFANKLYE